MLRISNWKLAQKLHASNKRGLIIGLAVGVVVCLVIAAVVVKCCCKKRKLDCLHYDLDDLDCEFDHGDDCDCDENGCSYTSEKDFV